MTTKPLALTGLEARQLFHGMEFAIKNLRESKPHLVPNIMTEPEYKKTEQRLLDLQTKMEQFALSFEA